MAHRYANLLRSRPPESSLLAAPPPVKMTTPEGDRLATIMENHSDYYARNLAKASPVPTQSRWSAHSSRSRSTLPRVSAEAQPPSYAQYDGKRNFNNGNGSRLSRLRERKGGWGRLCLIALGILLAIIALAVGLGVGLSRRNHNSIADSSQQTSTTQIAKEQQFPIGNFSLITALVDQQTDCTSDAATWACPPYSLYSASTYNTSMLTFQWSLSNTSDLYATNGSSLATDSNGVPANVSISALSDTFSWTFDAQQVTYINNASNPHYSVSFNMRIKVIPRTAVPSNGQSSVCYFNSTILSAQLYLSETREAPSKNYPGSADVAQVSNNAWPYAVHISQTSPGGTDVPECYYLVSDQPGARLPNQFQALSADDKCLCDYTNYV